MIRTLCLMIVLVATTSSEIAPSGILDDLFNILYNGIVALQNCSSTQVLHSKITYTLYTQENWQDGTTLTNTNFELINPHNRLIFIIHGWLQNGTQKWIIQMKNAYLNAAPANVVVLDWSYYADMRYGAAFCAVAQVGKFAGDLIYNLTTAAGINLSEVQINGFSLGGHVAGYAGQEIQSKSSGAKIGRIIGLDSAGPGFLGLPIDRRLDSSDALVVQGIHTSNAQYGYSSAYGTVDFHLNYGRMLGSCGAMQAGCPFNPGVTSDKTNNFEELLLYIFCNHVRAPVYFIESITSTNFIGVPCDSCRRFGHGMCKSESTIIMGENCPPTAKGEVYLNINGRSPFAMKSEGVP